MRLRKLLRHGAGWVLILFGCFTIFTLDRATLVLNVSSSLPDHAYLVYEWPLVLRRGVVVAADMPELLADRYAEAAYVKIIAGLPGDVITHNSAGEACINDICYPPVIEHGKPVGRAIKEGVIPEGHYALLGQSDDSLDSRYEAIGLMPQERIRATGFAVPLPEWKVMAEWF